MPSPKNPKRFVSPASQVVAQMQNGEAEMAGMEKAAIEAGYTKIQDELIVQVGTTLTQDDLDTLSFGTSDVAVPDYTGIEAHVLASMPNADAFVEGRFIDFKFDVVGDITAYIRDGKLVREMESHVYVGVRNRLFGKKALLRTKPDTDGRWVLAQFNDMTEREAFGWHAFKAEDFVNPVMFQLGMLYGLNFRDVEIIPYGG